MSETRFTVRQVMQTEPITVAADCPIRNVMDLMNRHRVGSILVVRDHNILLGIFSERDLLKRVIGATLGWRDFPVSYWMTSDPHTVDPEVDWDEAVGRMTRLRVRHLPVIENGRVIGIISTRSLMSRRAEYLDAKVEERTRELRELNDELLARDWEAGHNLRAAGKLQNHLLLPKSPPNWSEISWGIDFKPMDHLGGDYYDFAHPDADHIGFLIADASGHSIPAAMVAIMTRIAFAESSALTVHPGEVLTAINQRLVGLTEERFVTAFYGVFNRRTRILRYASAGHPYPLHVDGVNGGINYLANQGFLLGVNSDEVYGEKRLELKPNDRLVFYTDGLIEARNSIGEFFGMDRLTNCVRTHGRFASQIIVEEILECQSRFCDGIPLNDDRTLVVASFQSR